MPAGKNLIVNDGVKKVKISSLSGGRSLIDFPYKSHLVINSCHHKVPHIRTHSRQFKSKLKTHKTNTIGVLVHTLQSDFIKSALTGMEQEAGKLGYEMVIMHSQENMEREVANARMLLNQQVDGLIASLSFGTTSLHHFTLFADSGIPVVFFDRVDTTGNNGAVVIDNKGAGYMATHHLIQQGCKRIAIVTSGLERNVYADRFTGFRNALDDHNIPFENSLLIVNDLTEEAGWEAAGQILAMTERPDGLFVTNDLVAASCMRSLMEYGLKVPGDIAIVGFNNDPICKLTVPTITTINYPGIEMGRVAARQLIKKIAANLPAFTENTIVPVDLIVRHSSLKSAC